MPTSIDSRLSRNASRSSVSGDWTNDVPANGTSATRSPPSSVRRSWIASLARASRFGATSVASMLFEVSRAMTRSTPSLRTSCQRNPHIGPANANHQQSEREHREHGSCLPAARIEVGCDGRQQRRVDEAGAGRDRADETPRRRTRSPAGTSTRATSAVDRAPLHHGNFLSAVSASTNSSTNSSSAGHRKPRVDLAVLGEFRRLELGLLGAVDLAVDLTAGSRCRWRRK